MLGGKVLQLQGERQQVAFGVRGGVIAKVEFGQQALADQPLELPPALDVAVQRGRRYPEPRRNRVDAQPPHAQVAADRDDVVERDKRRSTALTRRHGLHPAPPSAR